MAAAPSTGSTPSPAPTQSYLSTTLGLSASVSSLNVLSLFSHSCLMISFLVYLNAAQPFLLDLLRLPPEESGALTGRLIGFDMLAALCCALVWGAIADRAGIRLVIPLGYALLAAGLGAYGAAQSYNQLLPFRMVFAAGASALTVTISTALGIMSAAPGASAHDASAAVPFENTEADETAPLLPSERAGQRTGQLAARLAGLVGLGSGTGALLAVFGYLRLPTLISTLFPSTAEDGFDLRLTFAFTAVLALSQGLFLIYGLRLTPDATAAKAPTLASTAIDPQPGAKRSLREEVVHAVKELPLGFHLARRDPHIALSFAAAFAARAASIVIAAYISLVVNLYFTKHGLCDPALGPSTLFEALQDGDGAKETCRPAYILASILSGTAQLCALLFAPIAGLLAARWSPPLVLTVTSLLGAVSFPLFGWGDDPRNGWIILAAVGIGISEIAANVISLGMLANARGRLMAQAGDEQAKELGGALGGAYSIFGSLGILIVGRLGGGLISLSPGAPFFIMGAVNVILLAGSLSVYVWAG